VRWLLLLLLQAECNARGVPNEGALQEGGRHMRHTTAGASACRPALPQFSSHQLAVLLPRLALPHCMLRALLQVHIPLLSSAQAAFTLVLWSRGEPVGRTQFRCFGLLPLLTSQHVRTLTLYR